ncbi:MAG: hypothetical protein HC896_12035 [Bacteroidales bacterium]|nr:hypothetical protein [Bacteroidales bacterium]
MKHSNKFNLWLYLPIALVVFSCENKAKEHYIKVTTDTNVVVAYKAVTFDVESDAEFVTFYSGEDGEDFYDYPVSKGK